MINMLNLETFFKNHPELKGRQDEIMTAASEKANEFGLIVAKDAEEILGDLSILFFAEVKNPDQIESWRKTIIPQK